MNGRHRSSTESVDQAALEQAVRMVRAHPQRNVELAELTVQRGWLGAAVVAAYDCQCRSLALPPWQQPPCMASVRGRDRAAKLLRRMLKREISRWHPRPLEAIAAAGPVKKKPSQSRGQNQKPPMRPELRAARWRTREDSHAGGSLERR